jgi:predicted kinase
MSIRRSARLENKEQTAAIYEDNEDDPEPIIKPKRKTAKSSKRTKSIRVEDGSNELVLTPPTPEITSSILRRKPWLSNEFADIAIRELGPKAERSVHPKMLILVGPPAAGKSTVKRQLDFGNAVNLDVDEFKILGVKAFGQSAKGMFADFGKIIQILGVKIINSGFDFILDTTGKMKEEIKYVIKKAKEASYTIDVAIVYSTAELCKSRAATRNIEYTERDPIPLKAVEKMHDEFITSKRAKSYLLGMKDIISMIDNLYLFDNSRCTPQAALIMEKHGKTTIIHEDFPDFYGVSISQLSPKLVAHGIKKTYKKTNKQKKINKTRKTRRNKY